MESILKLFSDYTFLVVAAGTAVLGMASGLIGSFAVLKKQSLLGDAVSHSALSGIALMFLLTGQKSTAAFLLGAFMAGVVSVYLISKIVRSSSTDYGTALALVMTVLFGVGLVLLTVIQKTPNANQAGIESFIFGSASAMLKGDVMLLSAVSAVLVITTLVFWKEFKLFSFDPEFAKTLGFSTTVLNGLLTFLIVGAVIVGIQAVGVILMSAMLIAPAVAARQWTDRLWVMVVLASVIGAVSGVAGAVMSSTINDMPTGPAIVVVVSLAVIVSLLFAPGRGVLWRAIKRARLKKEFGNNINKDGAAL